jgi:hypothetical protein
LQQRALVYLMKAKQPGIIGRLYESFLEFPAPVLMALLWLAGIVLLGVGAAALYLYWLLLQTVA